MALYERLLLDTQAIILWAITPEKLPEAVQIAIADSKREIYFSPVSAMEINTKVRIGKLDSARALAQSFASQMITGGFKELPLLSNHSQMAGSFISSNNDPWDRLLAAQARIEQMGFVTNDQNMDEFGIHILWK
jgi:PIN domain nuclease of toxin-antitoxin system